MAAGAKKQVTPPYVPYTTFTTFISGLKDNGLPSHIDRSVMSTMSGSGQSAMIATLKALRLINAESEPTDDLRVLVSGSEGDFSTTLNKLLRVTYSFLFDGSIKIENTTSKKVEEKFRAVSVSGSTLTKCISFFLAAAKAANIPVSPHVKAPRIQRKATPKKDAEKKEKPPKPDDGDGDLEPIHEGMEKITISLPGMVDGYIYFPAGMNDQQSKLAVKMAKFILDNYYGFEEGD